ncbi:MAG: CoA-binding protein [Candidatus Kariarchaeaceae archaeon]|jgi:predicted CoA-binding protein
MEFSAEPTKEEIKVFLSEPRTFAIYGASTQPEKAGYFVPRFLQKRGHSIILINPFVDEIGGTPTLSTLEELEEEVDILIIYRKGPATAKVAEVAITKSIKWIWLPKGVMSETTKQIALNAGKYFTQNLCPKELIEDWEKEINVSQP